MHCSAQGGGGNLAEGGRYKCEFWNRGWGGECAWVCVWGGARAGVQQEGMPHSQT